MSYQRPSESVTCGPVRPTRPQTEKALLILSLCVDLRCKLLWACMGTCVSIQVRDNRQYSRFSTLSQLVVCCYHTSYQTEAPMRPVVTMVTTFLDCGEVNVVQYWQPKMSTGLLIHCFFVHCQCRSIHSAVGTPYENSMTTTTVEIAGGKNRLCRAL